MPRLYLYVGSRSILQRAGKTPPGIEVLSANDVLFWLQQRGQLVAAGQGVIATYVVDPNGILRIADRHREHVACAGGGPVLAAGEITFCLTGHSVVVSEVSNQSAGYCPEPECWPAVQTALRRAGIVGPACFTTALIFRRCVRCGTTNIVKDGVFECAVCEAELLAVWNFQDKT